MTMQILFLVLWLMSQMHCVKEPPLSIRDNEIEHTSEPTECNAQSNERKLIVVVIVVVHSIYNSRLPVLIKA